MGWHYGSANTFTSEQTRSAFEPVVQLVGSFIEFALWVSSEHSGFQQTCRLVQLDTLNCPKV